LGIEILSYPKETEWGNRVVVKDFDGRKIELQEKQTGNIVPPS
jgi:hypothetical protein